MLAVLEYYTSGFWVWAGITAGIFATGWGVALVVLTIGDAARKGGA